MELDVLRAFEGEVRNLIPGFEVRYKNESTLQKVLGFLAYPFNRQYMTRYTTTIYPYVYFPTKEHYESQPKHSMNVLAHELVHLLDTREAPLWMRLSYALPQAAALLPLLAYGVLAGPSAWILAVTVLSYVLGCLLARKTIGLFWCVALGGVVAACVLAVLLTGWTSAFLFAGLAMMAPWPSRWRSNWELRGYSMNLALMQWTYGSVPEILKQSVLRQFVGSDYYFMSWSGDTITAKINEVVQEAQNGTLQTKAPYSTVYEFLASRGMLKK